MKIIMKKLSPCLAALLCLSMSVGCVNQYACYAKKDYTPPSRSTASPVKFHLRPGKRMHYMSGGVTAEEAARIYPGLFTSDTNAVPLVVNIEHVWSGGGLADGCMAIYALASIGTLTLIPAYESHDFRFNITVQIPDVSKQQHIGFHAKSFTWQTRGLSGFFFSPLAYKPLAKPYDIYAKDFGMGGRLQSVTSTTIVEAVATILSEKDLEAISQLYNKDNTYVP